MTVWRQGKAPSLLQWPPERRPETEERARLTLRPSAHRCAISRHSRSSASPRRFDAAAADQGSTGPLDPPSRCVGGDFRWVLRRPTVDGAPPLVHLHNLYAGGQRTTYISIFLTPEKNIRHIKRPKATLKAKCYSGGRFCVGNGELGKGYGDKLCAPAANVKVMEMHKGPRPVYGGPGLMGVNIWTQTKSHGGSRGPLDPWSASTASKRWDLWFFRSRKNNDNSICCKKDGRQLTPITNLQDKPR